MNGRTALNETETETGTGRAELLEGLLTAVCGVLEITWVAALQQKSRELGRFMAV
ncbi:hypothetical protein GCM10010313_81880 [Streptomyces violarus]|uniref:Uncharacterized protein n=1 Tax=Streptomyces violarus TaxID=67380 RepID=A0A7W4ZZU8_9ACTN|nr:hypothetical protein [Streptomyces violarus]GHD34891.1 hypothetical protein GCM10010313_81880 [Streptomyces violarus]